MTAAVWRLLVALAATLHGMGCRDSAEAREQESRAPVAGGVATGVSREGATHVRTIIGFQDPESVRYDPGQDVIFVSNVAGFGSLEDGNGYINRIDAADFTRAEVFVQSGRNGAVLNAPKGMAIQGDTLWVTDIRVVRGFHRRTGMPVGTIDFTAMNPVQLNDIAVGPDGTLRVSDTGIQMVYEGNVHVGGDRLFSVGPGHAITVVAEGAHLRQPNGVTWDSAGGRWIVLSFDRHAGEVAAMGAQDTARTVLRRGSGQLDGVESLSDGTLLFSSWSDSSIHALRGSSDSRIIRELPEPADIGVDTRRGRVLIPLAVLGQVQVWNLGGRR